MKRKRLSESMIDKVMLDFVKRSARERGAASVQPLAPSLGADVKSEHSLAVAGFLFVYCSFIPKLWPIPKIEAR